MGPFASGWNVKVPLAMALAGVGAFLPAGPALASAVDYLTGPLYEPINADSPLWLRYLVWNDFKLALLVFVLIPLAIWAWSLVRQQGQEDAVKRIMFGYWQAASLLMFTVYLQIGAQPLSFATAAAVQMIIPFTLFWWKDLGQEVAADDSPLARTFKVWRPIATGLAVVGGLTQLLATQVTCTLLPGPAAVTGSPFCAAWLEPPFRYKDIFHAGMSAEKLQVIGQAGACFFVANFLFYLLVSLPTTGRLARSNNSISYKVLAKIGFYKS